MSFDTNSADEDELPHMVDECSTCRFWNRTHANKGDGDSGQCRMNPPVIVPGLYEPEPDDDMITLVEMMSRWPFTISYDWCGQHKSRLTLGGSDAGGNA